MVFIALNATGVSIAATFELVVTLLAVVELLVFAGVVAPGWSLSNFVAHGWAGADTFSAGTWAGIFAAIPFAIWFFLAIEGRRDGRRGGQGSAPYHPDRLCRGHSGRSWRWPFS